MKSHEMQSLIKIYGDDVTLVTRDTCASLPEVYSE